MPSTRLRCRQTGDMPRTQMYLGMGGLPVSNKQLFSTLTAVGLAVLWIHQDRLLSLLLCKALLTRTGIATPLIQIWPSCLFGMVGSITSGGRMNS